VSGILFRPAPVIARPLLSSGNVRMTFSFAEKAAGA
jgi:hypothetical protein